VETPNGAPAGVVLNSVWIRHRGRSGRLQRTV